jgi:hypothetical protein
VLIYRSATLHKKTQEVEHDPRETRPFSPGAKISNPPFFFCKNCLFASRIQTILKNFYYFARRRDPFCCASTATFSSSLRQPVVRAHRAPLPASSVALFRLQKREKRLHFLQFLLYIVERMNVLLKKG